MGNRRDFRQANEGEQVPGVGIMRLVAQLPPVDGAIGYGAGCLWQAYANGGVYLNVGTAQAAAWEPVLVSGASAVPTGGVLLYAAPAPAAPPTGYLACDGSAVSRTTYADLFALIGTTYGAGDGSTTFNLPNIPGDVIPV